MVTMVIVSIDNMLEYLFPTLFQLYSTSEFYNIIANYILY